MKNKILFIFLLVIILALDAIPLFAKNEIPDKYADAYSIIGFVQKYNYPNEIYDEISIETIESWIKTLNKRYDNLSVNIKKQLEKAKNEKKETVDEIKDKKQNVTTIENAYKTIPDINASVSEIDTFIKSDAAYNELKSLKTVSKETAQKWKTTVEAARTDTISRQMYTETVETLNDYINGKDIGGHTGNLSNQIKNAVNSTQNYIRQLEATVYGSNDARDSVEFKDVLDNVDFYKPDEISDPDAKTVEKKVGTVVAIITNIAMIVAVIIPAVLGVKYMLGSVEEKADYKKDMIPYLIGAVLIFGISLVVKIVQQFGNTINSL